MLLDGFDVGTVPLVDNHSHAGLYERRLRRVQTLADLEGADGHYRTSTYQALMREALADLYGEPGAWQRGVDAQYADGIESAYTRMFERLDIRMALWDFRRLVSDGWPPERYRPILWLDPFICPFPDPSLWRGEELRGALEQALALDERSALPETFDGYLAFVVRTLRTARPRLVGLKLALGYQRTLRFDDVSRVDAGKAYARLLRGEAASYSALQNFLARRLFQLAGEMELPLQVHASFGGPGSNLRLANNDPSLLQPLLSDADFRATRVVLLHGGYPFVGEAGALAWQYPQVYLDFSVLPTLFAGTLARWLEEWIELLPANKLLFGSDASSPEEYWTAAVNGRRQIGAALRNLVNGGTLTRPDAAHLAERICHANAIDLYRL
jgi:predicted TIM-barrel fold metal-dependent hydrolase